MKHAEITQICRLPTQINQNRSSEIVAKNVVAHLYRASKHYIPTLVVIYQQFLTPPWRNAQQEGPLYCFT